MNVSRQLIAATICLGALAPTARAQMPTVFASEAWSRATPPGATTGAVYLTLTSPGGDTLTGVSSPAAQSADLHTMSMEGSVMRMRPVTGGLTLPPGQPVVLQPGGYHIMLSGLKAPLKQGQTIQLHLTFATSAPVDVAAKVAGIGASKPPAAGTMPGMRTP